MKVIDGSCDLQKRDQTTCILIMSITHNIKPHLNRMKIDNHQILWRCCERNIIAVLCQICCFLACSVKGMWSMYSYHLLPSFCLTPATSCEVMGEESLSCSALSFRIIAFASGVVASLCVAISYLPDSSLCHILPRTWLVNHITARTILIKIINLSCQRVRYLTGSC